MQAEYMSICSTCDQGPEFQWALFQQCMPYNVRCIESDSHLAIYTIYVLDTINTMMNLKQYALIVLLCVETKWPGS